MQANEYQKLAGRTLIDRPDRKIPTKEVDLAYNVILLATEMGIVAERAKKRVFHQHDVSNDHIEAELSRLSQTADLTAAALGKREEVNTDASDYEIMLLWNLTGLVGEAGEVAYQILNPLDRKDIADELGDLLWYIAALATRLGLNLDDIMSRNIEKLRTRYPHGYSAEASQKREDMK